MENGKVLSPDDETKALQLIGLLELHKEIADFLQPVDFKALGIPEYPVIVKQPMDIGTIKKNLKAYRYSSIDEVLKHIQLIWDNCKQFNDQLTVAST